MDFGFLGRRRISDHIPRVLKGSCSIVFTAVLIGLSILPGWAQQGPIILKGHAVVTGYSGVALLKPAAVAKPADYAIINQQGATLQIFDLSQMDGPDNARLVKAPRLFSVTAGQIGQVFGVALDDGGDRRARDRTPNIYATATSVFGLQVVKTIKGVRNRAKVGGQNRTWMVGQFGVSAGGGPGSIWKIDGLTGTVSLFANVTLNGRPNSGPALGNITFDRDSRQLFVSDLQTGMVHAFDLDGKEVGIFDHGVEARPQLGLPKARYNLSRRVEISSPRFDALKPATWGYADKARRVWGLAVSNRRLFYSVAEGPEIWSVGINEDGTFAKDATVETEVQAPTADSVSDIAFGRDGTMYLSQRGEGMSSYDYTVLAKPQTASVLRYRKRRLGSGRVGWQPEPEEYAVGLKDNFRNANGGVALGYGYDRFGFIRDDACKNTLWSTGELLRQDVRQARRLKRGGPMVVHGLQGNGLELVRPDNEGPLKSYFIDFDSNHVDPTYRGHMGDIAIWSACSRQTASSGQPQPPLTTPPVGPRVRIAKSCSGASFGSQMLCRVTLTSTGSQAPDGPIGFSDFADVIIGPTSAAAPLILSAMPDGPDWRCSPLPASDFECSIDGAELPPGQSRSVDVVMDISGLIATTGWRIRNCATLDGTLQEKCVTRGEDDSLLVIKSGPNQQPCTAGGPCDFQISVFNLSKRIFDGNLFFGDDLTIGGQAATGVRVDNVAPPHGCLIAGTRLPLQWQCHTTIAPGDFKAFSIQLTLPASAAAGGPTTGRNCFAVSAPGLALFGGNTVPANFWSSMLNPANASNMPGRSCVDFAIQPIVQPPSPPPPPCGGGGIPINPKMQLSMTAKPSTFSAAGQAIKYTYTVTNQGPGSITTFAVRDPKGASIRCQPTNQGPVGGPIAAGARVKCERTYTTTVPDIDRDINSTSKVVGTYCSGAVTPATAKVKVKWVDPPISAAKLQITSYKPSPATFSAANQAINYTYVIHNNGTAAVTRFKLRDDRGKLSSGQTMPQHVAVTCPSYRIPPSRSVTCTGSYATKAGDVGHNIDSVAIAGSAYDASGISVNTWPPATTVVKFVAPPPPRAKLQITSYTARPATYSAANQKIIYTYVIRNIGTAPVSSFTPKDTAAIGIRCRSLSIQPSRSVTCTGSYTTKASNVGSNIASTASVINATDGIGAVPPPPPATTVVKFVAPPPPRAKLQITSYTARPATYSAANQKIIYTYVIRNIGTAPVSSFTPKDTAAIGIRCRSLSIQPSRSVTCTGSYTTKASNVGSNIASTASVINATDGIGAVPPPPPATTVVKFVAPPPPRAKLQITSYTARPATYSAANQKIIYTYVIRNIGTAPVSSFTPKDTAAIGIRCRSLSIQPSRSVTCTGSYTTKASNVGSNIASTASVINATDGIGAVPPPPPATTVVKFVAPPPPRAKLQITSYTARPATYSAANQKIIYTYVIRNIGTAPVSSFTPKDTAAIGIRCRSLSIQPSRSVTCTGSYTTKASNVGSNIASTASVINATDGIGAVPPPPPATTVVKFVAPPPPRAKLQITSYTARPATYSAANQKIIYTYVIRNIGTAPVSSFTPKDTAAIGIRCRSLSIQPSRSVTCTGSYTTKASNVGSNIASTASVINATDGIGAVPPPPPATTVVKFVAPPPPRAKLQITSYTARPATYSAANQKIIYTYVIRNIGTAPVSSFTPKDTAAIGIRCRSLSIQPSRSVTCTGSYTTKASNVGSNIASTASVINATDGIGAVPPPPPATTVVKFVAPPPPRAKLQITSYTARPATYSAANQKIIYTYVIRNIGTAPVSSFTPKDTAAIGIRCRSLSIQPSRSVTCTGSYTTKASNVGSNIASTASVINATDGIGAVPPPPPATAVLRFIPKPRLNIVVSPTTVTFKGVGEKINFTYTVTNIGNIPLKSFVLKDPKVANITCKLTANRGSLAINATTTCTGSYTTTRADVDREKTSWNYALSGNASTPVTTQKGTITATAPPRTASPQEVLDELNLARRDPGAYAKFLEDLKPYYKDKDFRKPGDKVTIRTGEGLVAVNEAIEYLKNFSTLPLPVLSLSKGLSKAAEDIAKDQAANGGIGHKLSTGVKMSERMNRYGTWEKAAGENIAYGCVSARDCVVALIIDDSVASRGHRKNIFNATFEKIGVATGPHRDYGTMTVTEFAGGYEER